MQIGKHKPLFRLKITGVKTNKSKNLDQFYSELVDLLRAKE
ncbi:MAG TPA: hypothetical protein VJG83_06315 [archaeon]|nr:hypothetical protein [archaeon]